MAIPTFFNFDFLTNLAHSCKTVLDGFDQHFQASARFPLSCAPVSLHSPTKPSTFFQALKFQPKKPEPETTTSAGPKIEPIVIKVDPGKVVAQARREPEPEVQPEAEPEPESEPEVELESEPEAEVELDSEAEPEPVVAVKPKTAKKRRTIGMPKKRRKSALSASSQPKR